LVRISNEEVTAKETSKEVEIKTIELDKKLAEIK